MPHTTKRFPTLLAGALATTLLCIVIARCYAAATATVTLAGTVTGLVDGSVTVGPITISANSAVYQRTTPSLSSGDNTINVPTGATCCIVIFPTGNTQAVKFKGAGGDTGLVLKKTGTNLLQLDSTQTTIIINAAGSVNGTTLIFF